MLEKPLLYNKRKLLQVSILILVYETKPTQQPNIKIWISCLILVLSYLNHIEFFILQNKGKYILPILTTGYFVRSSILFGPSISFGSVISNFWSSSVYSCFSFSSCCSEDSMISSFNYMAAKAFATNSTFLPEVFNHLTAKKFASCIVVKFKKSSYFSDNIST